MNARRSADQQPARYQPMPPSVDLSGPGLLITELLAGDGPHIASADDFVRVTCSDCRTQVDGELWAADGSYVCVRCLKQRWWKQRQAGSPTD